MADLEGHVEAGKDEPVVRLGPIKRDSNPFHRLHCLGGYPEDQDGKRNPIVNALSLGCYYAKRIGTEIYNRFF